MFSAILILLLIFSSLVLAQEKPLLKEKSLLDKKQPCENCVLKPKIIQEKKVFKAETKEYLLTSKKKLEVKEDELYYNDKKLEFQPDSALDLVIEKIKPKKIEKIELEEGIYKVESKKKFKLFGFIPTEIKVKTEIDPETGKIKKERRSWFSFFGREDDSEIDITSMGYSNDPCRRVCKDEFKSCISNNHGNPSGLKECNQERGNCLRECEEPVPPVNPPKPPISTGESRFGIHVGRLDLKEEISELGDIYSRINIDSDAHGWKMVKGNQESIALCESCCREPGCANKCEAEYIYYCEPENRENIGGKDIADGFYADKYKILFSVSPGSYGLKPKNIQDLLSLDYPTAEQVYKDYIGYLVQQYPNVEYWEVLNEADNPQFWGDTPKNYARLFTLTSNEIKSYCPDCMVGISLVGPNPSDEWFNAITNICNDLDFLDLHQYHSETMDELKEFEAIDLTKWEDSCRGVEIISTETGIPSESITFKDNTWVLGTSETKQAQDSIKYLTMMFNAGYDKIYYYLFDLDFVPGVRDIFELTGLLNEDNSKKTAFETYDLIIEKLNYFTTIEKLAEGQYRYSFEDKDSVYVLWCEETYCATRHENIPTENIKITDYLGNPQSEFTLSESPIFVEKISD